MGVWIPSFLALTRPRTSYAGLGGGRENVLNAPAKLSDSTPAHIIQFSHRLEALLGQFGIQHWVPVSLAKPLLDHYRLA